MLTAYLKRHDLPGFAKAAALAAVGAALGWSPIDATAAQRLDAPRPAQVRDTRVQDADLEQLFWLCDHAATKRMVDASERAVCGAVAERLKMEKFGGDFETMLNWWRKNKSFNIRTSIWTTSRTRGSDSWGHWRRRCTTPPGPPGGLFLRLGLFEPVGGRRRRAR
jgi:hypothetical protein